MNWVVVFVALPLFGAFLIPILHKTIKMGSKFLSLLVSLLLLAASVYLVARPFVPQAVYPIGSWQAPYGITWLFDGFTGFMLLVINVISFFVTIYSFNYMEQYTSRWKYYTLFMLLVAGLNGVVVTGDIFNLYVFLEIATIASYALVAFGTEAEEIEAAFKYMVLGSISSAFILLGIGFLYSKTGTLNMFDMAQVLSGDKNIVYLKLFVSTLFIVGFGLKAAIMPFHAWLPDAHPSAPAPISAMLSGLVIKTVGIYALFRIFFNVMGMDGVMSEMLLALGAISMIVGVILAIGQWDLKRLLAYHSISQIGYIVAGLALATPLGILGGLFHLMNHSVFKSLLFLNAGSVEYATGTRDLKKLGGLQEVMPNTAWTSMVASLSISGIPPFCGFWSKLIIVIALFQAGRFGYGFIAIVAGVITLGSFLKVQKFIFYRKVEGVILKVKESPGLMVLSMVALAVLCFVIGIGVGPVKTVILDPAVKVLGQGTGYFISLLKV